jgi:integrase/recombinase XerD
MAGIGPDTEVPPPRMIAGRQRWRLPFIYGPAEIDALLARCRSLHHQLPAATHETLFGLLAVTGIRIGEAIRLDGRDIDWTTAVLTIHESKFGESRMVLVLESTVAALDRYARTRDRLCPQPTASTFFVSMTGTRLIYQIIEHTFPSTLRQRGNRS